MPNISLTPHGISRHRYIFKIIKNKKHKICVHVRVVLINTFLPCVGHWAYRTNVTY